MATHQDQTSADYLYDEAHRQRSVEHVTYIIAFRVRQGEVQCGEDENVDQEANARDHIQHSPYFKVLQKGYESALRQTQIKISAVPITFIDSPSVSSTIFMIFMDSEIRDFREGVMCVCLSQTDLQRSTHEWADSPNQCRADKAHRRYEYDKSPC